MAELPIKRVKQIMKMAKEDWMDGYESGHFLDPADDFDKQFFKDAGLKTKQEQQLYVSTYEALYYN